MRYIYLASFGPIYKIGTSRKPYQRLKFLQYVHGLEKGKMLLIKPDAGFIEEGKIHRAFKKFRVHKREWYAFTASQLKRVKKFIKSVQL